ncbi:pH-sensitive chloride channel 2-like [Macrosteles quadrilineatus]|uniref:pH-sensitive chloride channel 2-like n=1 Tax=Macrosteles quadrilineatus TaxID=74068 RepID=UPI0023E34FE4|nr:pH-sensitive chloride channel 2-like [Macrosteles quadrilineatus]
MNTTTYPLFVILLCIVSLKHVIAQQCKSVLQSSGSALAMLDQLTDPCRYNKWQRPIVSEKTKVFTHIHVYSIVNMDPLHLEYTVQILLRFRWSDPRLRQANVLRHEGDELRDMIWHPHLYITNEQHSTVMGSSQKDVMNSIWPDGTIVSLSRKKITLRCEMDLQKFPFDQQYCPIIIESWSYNTSQLELVWEDVTVDSQLHLPEYLLLGVITNSSTASYMPENKGSGDGDLPLYGKTAGNFSTLSVYFTLKRLYGFYIMDYYVPSALIVIVSWVSFWLDANSTPGRTILGTSTLLTFITLSRNIGSSLPKVSYVKSSEVWYLGCIGFLFSSLAEFAFVNVIWRRTKNVNLKKVTGKHILQSTLTPQIYRKELGLNPSKSMPSMCPVPEHYTTPKSKLNGDFSIYSSTHSSMNMQDRLSTAPLSVPKLEGKGPSKTLFTMTPQEIANWIDRRSRLLFPIAFVIFNCVYWIWTLIML